MKTESVVIRLENVRKVFMADEVETHALGDVHLGIEQGEYVAIEGPSGSGKSTLLAILGLLDVPTSGSYELFAQAVEKLEPAARATLRNEKIGFIFQTFNLIGDLTVLENVELPLVYCGVPARERRERARRALERVKLSNRERHMPSQLSGGQQQRAAVARAIAGDPAILLADEPTGSLDSHNGEVVMDLLAELGRSGTTIIMVTHNPAYARQASRIVHLFDGRIVEDVRSRAA